MKKILTLFYSCLFFNITFGQQQITHYVSDNLNQRHILQEVDGEKYILSIDKLDSLKVYKIENNKAVFMHSRYYASLYNEYNFTYTNKHVLIENAKGSISYDFISNEEYWIYYNGSHTYSRWTAPYKGFAFLTQSTQDFTNQIHYLVDLNNKSKEVISESKYFGVLGINEHFIYIRDYDSTANHELHLVENRANNAIDTMAKGEFNGNVYFGDSAFVYVSNLEIVEYDFHTKASRKIGQVNSPYDVKIIDNETDYICSNTLKSKTFITVINKLTLESTLDSLIEDFDRPHSDIVQNKLIYGDFSYIIVYDLSSKQSYTYHSNSKDPENCAILDDRYLVHKFFYSLMMIDLQTLAQDTLLGNVNYGANFYKVENLKLENGYLINFESKSENPYKLIEVDVIQKKAVIANVLPKFLSGLVKGSTVVKLGNDIILLADTDVYHVQENIALKLNTFPLLKTIHDTYKIDGDKLMWLEKNGTEIKSYTFSNGTVTHHATFSSLTNEVPFTLNIYDFLITSDFTYFQSSGFEQNYYRVIHLTGEVEKIDESNASFSFYNLLEANGNIYYFTKEGLDVVLSGGETKTINLEFPKQGFLSLFKYKGQVYTFAIDGFYRLNGAGFEQLIPLTNEETGFNYLYDSGDYCIVDAGNKRFIFDGISLTELTAEFENSNLLSADILAISKSTGINTIYTQLYNRQTQQFLTLPNEIATMRLVSIFTNFNTNYLVAKSGFHPYYNIHIFRINEDYTTFIEVKKFESSGWDSKVNFKAYGNEGLLYVGSKIYLMNDTIGFEYVSHLAGDEEAVVSVEKDGYFYFMAIHPTEGRQLFRTIAISLRVGTDEVTNAPTLKILPNPVSDRLAISTKAGNLSAYTIYNTEGKVAQKGLLDGDTIQISTLDSGVYILSITDENGVKLGAAKFFKL